MFQTKKKKSENYLVGKKMGKMTAFDQILNDYISGELKRKLESLGMRKIEIHIDWHSNYKCIGIQCLGDVYRWGIMIEHTEFLIAFDEDEPDEDNFYPLESKEQFYQILENAIKMK